MYCSVRVMATLFPPPSPHQHFDYITLLVTSAIVCHIYVSLNLRTNI